MDIAHTPLFSRSLTNSFCSAGIFYLGATPTDARGLIMVLCSGITPSYAQNHIEVLGMESKLAVVSLGRWESTPKMPVSVPRLWMGRRGSPLLSKFCQRCLETAVGAVREVVTASTVLLASGLLICGLPHGPPPEEDCIII